MKYYGLLRVYGQLSRRRYDSFNRCGLTGTAAAIPLVTKRCGQSETTTLNANYFLGISGGKLAADSHGEPQLQPQSTSIEPIGGDGDVDANDLYEFTFDFGTLGCP